MHALAADRYKGFQMGDRGGVGERQANGTRVGKREQDRGDAQRTSGGGERPSVGNSCGFFSTGPEHGHSIAAIRRATGALLFQKLNLDPAFGRSCCSFGSRRPAWSRAFSFDRDFSTMLPHGLRCVVLILFLFVFVTPASLCSPCTSAATVCGVSASYKSVYSRDVLAISRARIEQEEER